MKSHTKLPLLVCASLIAALGAGCTHMEKVQPKTAPVVYGSTKNPARLALVLDKELAAFQFRFSMMGDTWQYPFGPALNDYARNVTSALFDTVTVVGGPEELAGKPADIVLHLKAVKAEQTMPSTAFGLRKFSLIVTWTARDRTNTKDLWIKTLTGYSEEAAGNVFTQEGHKNILFQKLFDDLTKRTVDAMTQSPELARAGK